MEQNNEYYVNLVKQVISDAKAARSLAYSKRKVAFLDYEVMRIVVDTLEQLPKNMTSVVDKESFKFYMTDKVRTYQFRMDFMEEHGVGLDKYCIEKIIKYLNAIRKKAPF